MSPSALFLFPFFLFSRLSLEMNFESKFVRDVFRKCVPPYVQTSKQSITPTKVTHVVSIWLIYLFMLDNF